MQSFNCPASKRSLPGQETSRVLRHACDGVARGPASMSLEGLEVRQLLTLMLDYGFDVPPDSGTTVVDRAPDGGVQDGTLFEGTARVAGRVGQGALDFDGVNDVFAGPGELKDYLGMAGSLAFWIKTTQTGTTSSLTSPGVTGIDELN